MTWLSRYFSSSIGRKQFVAVTGLLLCGFLVAHLAGNLLLLKSAEAFNAYADSLAHNPLIVPMELGLAGLFLAHILMAVFVTARNRAARPERYDAAASAGGRTLASSTMIWTGLVTLAFLLVHLKTFRFAPDRADLFSVVMAWFKVTAYALFYATAMLFMGVHISHGFSSAFQTLGVSHPKYTPLIKAAGIVFAIVICAGFAVLPLWGRFLRG